MVGRLEDEGFAVETLECGMHNRVFASPNVVSPKMRKSSSSSGLRS